MSQSIDGVDVDMTQAQALIGDLKLLLTELDGTTAHYEGSNKDKMHYNANASRSLLYAAHLADVTRAEILNQYHRWRGQDTPTIEA